MFDTIFISARGFGGRCASANSPRQLKEVIQCLIQTLVRSQLWVCWLARFVGNELAPAARPQTMRAGFRHARDRGPQRTDAPMQLPRGHLVRMDSCSSRGGVRKGSAVFSSAAQTSVIGLPPGPGRTQQRAEACLPLFPTLTNSSGSSKASATAECGVFDAAAPLRSLTPFVVETTGQPHATLKIMIAVPVRVDRLALLEPLSRCGVT